MGRFSCGVSGRRGEGEGACTPANLQVILTIPWRYGLTAAEVTASKTQVRIQSFVSRAIFPSATCVLRVGGPVVGYIEPTNGEAKSAQLVSWIVTVLIECFDMHSTSYFRPRRRLVEGFSYRLPNFARAE